MGSGDNHPAGAPGLCLLCDDAGELAVATALDELELAAIDPGAVALCDAAAEGNGPAVTALLAQGVSVDGWGRAGTTALIEAASAGHCHTVEALLEHGASMGATDTINWSALHYSAFNGQLGCVEILVEAGSVLGALSTDGETALELALQNQKRAVAEYLLGLRLAPAAVEVVLLERGLPEPPGPVAEAEAQQELCEPPLILGVDELAAMELEVMELDAELELAELDQQLQEAAAAAAELDYDSEDVTGVCAGQRDEGIALIGTSMVTFYQATAPAPPGRLGDDGRRRQQAWLEPFVHSYYRTRMDAFCRDDEQLLAALMAIGGGEAPRDASCLSLPALRLLTLQPRRDSDERGSITTRGLWRFCTELRRLQEIEATPVLQVPRSPQATAVPNLYRYVHLPACLRILTFAWVWWPCRSW